MEEKFVVIGSNSFSGACFSDHALKENPQAKVMGISRSPEPADFFLPYKKSAPERFTFMQADLNSGMDDIMRAIGDFKPDYIVNFSAQGMVAESWGNPMQWFRTNCMAILELAHRLTQEGVQLKRFVQISSPEVYGTSQGESEATVKYLPSTPYAASKAAGDLALYPYFLHKGLPVAYVRSTNVYGAYQQLYRIMPRTVLYIKMGRKIQLHGGGSAVKSYIHIRDVCEATLRIARDGRNGEVYHISPDDEGISIYDLVSLIASKMGVKMENCTEVVGERLGQDAAYIINSEKVRGELGWRPAISLGEGVEEVIAWVEDYYDEILRQPMDYIHKP